MSFALNPALRAPPLKPVHEFESLTSAAIAPDAFGRIDLSRADDGIRTRDLRFTKPLLYQLSYVGAERAKIASTE